MQLREHATTMQSPLEIPFPANWLESLYQLLKASPNAKYRRVHALLVAVADGNFEGGMMLYWLLKLLPKSKRADGAVYKSAVQWQAECGLTKNQVKRVNKSILSRFFDITVKKAQGAPTNHYCLKAWAFLHRLGDVLNLPAYYLLLKMHKAANGFATKQPMDLLQSSQSLTIESTIETSNDVVKNNVVPSEKIVDFKSPLPESTPEQLRVIDLLKKAHVPGQSAVSFALLPETVVRDCIASAQSAFDAKRTKNRVGYLIGALRKQLAVFKAQPVPVTQVTAEPEPISDSHQTNFAADLLDNLSEPVAPVPDKPVNERLHLPINDRNTTPQSAWNAAYQQLRLQMDYGTFNGYFLHAELVDYEPDCFVVKVQNTHVRDMCQHRFIRTATRILRDVIGRDVSIRYETDESPDAPLQRFLSKKELGL